MTIKNCNTRITFVTTKTNKTALLEIISNETSRTRKKMTLSRKINNILTEYVNEHIEKNIGTRQE